MGLELIASNIWKSYNGNPALMGCSFSFDAGNAYALMGPNGSGKSTFLRICALLEEPDKGKINYFSDGDVVKKDIGLKRRTTLVLPRVGVFNITVFKNVAYGLTIRGIKGEEIEEKTNKLLDFVGLAHKRNHNALTLSSGETQRLGIARAMVIEPDIIFLDEPTASVDKENAEIIEDIILEMKTQRRTTIILTTHDTSQAERLAEKILFMDKGKFKL